MKVLCPKCGSEVAPDNVNVAKDTGYCESCKELFSLSELQHSGNTEEQHGEDMQLLQQEPPSGVELMRSTRETIVLARHSRLHLLFIVPFTAFWGGGSMFAIYGTQIIKHQFDLKASLFGLPFLFGTIFLLFLIIYPLLSWVMIRFNSIGVIIKRLCFKKPELEDDFQVSSSSMEEMPSKNGYWKWENIKNVRVQASNQSNRTYTGYDESTVIIPALPRNRQNYMLAVLREEARKRNIALNVQEELSTFTVLSRGNTFSHRKH
ncbi:MAG: hypothetical protein J5746_05650 [Victivallales bacterium]|nr:hypothetical protein [Victivallales bacterium]